MTNQPITGANTRKKHPVRIAAITLASFGLVAIGAMSSGQAATNTATMSVSANIAGTCTVGAASMGFGTYVSTAASTASAAFQVSCSNGTSAQVSLNQGSNNNKASTFGTRALANGATNFLGYDIYTDNTYATAWNTANTVPVVSTGSPVTLTAFGRVPAGQNPATGSYNDQVTITVTF